MDLKERFPALQDLGETAYRVLADCASAVTMPPGSKAFEAGASCENYLVLGSGRVRVQQVTESGREIVLYRVGGGETCILTTACLLAHENYSAEAIAETEVSALVVPRACFERLLAESPPFRDFVFTAYAHRITDLMLLVQEVAFGHMDIRLAQRLLELSDAAAVVPMTHQDLAVELGTAREVVSRQLKEFERRGWVRLERGRIHILEIAALGDLAESSAT